MDYQYDDFINKIVKHIIRSLERYGVNFYSYSYGELVYVIHLYAKEFADSNLADFAHVLNNPTLCDLPVQQSEVYIEKHYYNYLEHRM